MKKLTKNQVLGTKFEIWLEHFLKKAGYQNVMRNIEYHKTSKLFRQVDLKYDLVIGGKIEQVLVEAKFSSNGPIKYSLRDGLKTKSGQKIQKIDNMVDEIYEKYLFVDAGKFVLVTNKDFDKRIVKNAAEKGIITINGSYLSEMNKKLSGSGNIESEIYKQQITDRHCAKNIVQIAPYN